MEHRVRKILTSLIAILAATNLEAQQSTPKLVVCITVDQLRGDYIEYFYNTFGERGFKRLMNEGLVYNNIRFEFSDIDEASAFATLFTGSNPNFNGIAGKNIYDFDKEKEVSVLYDPDYIGNYTKEHYSPRKLISSTIGDELKIASKGRSICHCSQPRKCDPFRRTCGKRCFLDGRLQRQMGNNDLLQRASLVCGPLQQRPGISVGTFGADDLDSLPVTG